MVTPIDFALVNVAAVACDDAAGESRSVKAAKAGANFIITLIFALLSLRFSLLKPPI